jgi:hypothetical protein
MGWFDIAASIFSQTRFIFKSVASHYCSGPHALFGIPHDLRGLTDQHRLSSVHFAPLSTAPIKFLSWGTHLVALRLEIYVASALLARSDPVDEKMLSFPLRVLAVIKS